MSLEAWLEAHKDETETLENGKIRCKISGHDIPCRLDALEQHWAGRVYRRAAKTNEIRAGKVGIDFQKYAPHFVPHKRDPTKVYCRLTKFTLNNDVGEVEAHQSGRKFKYNLRFVRVPKEKKVREPKEQVAEEGSFWKPDESSDEEDEAAVKAAEQLGFPVAVSVVAGKEAEKKEEGSDDEPDAEAEGKTTQGPKVEKASGKKQAGKKRGKPTKAKVAKPDTATVVAAKETKAEAPSKAGKPKKKKILKKKNTLKKPAAGEGAKCDSDRKVESKPKRKSPSDTSQKKKKKQKKAA